MDDVKKETEKSLDEKIRDFLDLAMMRLKKCVDADEHNRLEAIDDLNFLNGDQWDPKEKQKRKLRGRPTLQINLLPKFVDQVVGDERKNRPRVKIRPVDSKADVHIAKIREGIISSIEYNSSSPAIYDESFESMVSCGYGAWRVLTRYTEEDPFLQEIYMQLIENPFLVYMDPDSKDPSFADAKYGFIIEKMDEDKFKEEYPGQEFPTDIVKYGTGLGQENWYADKQVTVAEYFVRETIKRTMCLMYDGQVLSEEDAAQQIQEWEEKTKLSLHAPSPVDLPPPQVPTGSGDPSALPMQPPLPGMAPPMVSALPANPMAVPTGTPTPVPFDNTESPRIIKKRSADVPIIKHYIISASDIIKGDLSGSDFPGKYVPIVLMTGKRRNIEGKRFIRGLVRDAKDPQRMINYWNTSAAETVALSPKAPWLGTPKHFENFENDYAAANTENYPFLKFNIDPMNPALIPQRNHPGDPPVAIFAQIARGEENLKSVIGMFNADVGAQGPEITGAAINARQRPGDIGTFAFLDNLSRAVMHSGRIINEMIPSVYDTERDIRVRHLDDTETHVPVNTTIASAMKMMKTNPDRFRGMDMKRLEVSAKKHGRQARFNDLTIGKYDVVVSIGPSYATARAEAVDVLTKLLQTNPQMASMAMDLVVENLDFKDADKLAARFRKMLPPGLVPPDPSEEPPAPKPPDPKMLIAKAKMDVELERLNVQKERAKVEQIKALKEAADAKGDVKKMIMEILMDLHSPQHPADQTSTPPVPRN
jgi:hypothetical protein